MNISLAGIDLAKNVFQVRVLTHRFLHRSGR
jgi:hypothetical protein